MDQTLTSDFASFPRICVGQSQPVQLVPAGFEQLAAEFEAATGWVLRFDESQSSQSRREVETMDSIPVGSIAICDMSASWPAGKNTASREKCDRLAERISHLFKERQNALLKLRQSEPADCRLNVSKLQQPTHDSKRSYTEGLDELVGELLAACSRIAGAASAAVCLIDDESKHLTTQFSQGDADWLGATRPLPNCPADIEALCGSAIVMKDAESVKNWHCPNNCKSAICLPISSATTLLGTLWVFGDQPQDFDDQTIYLLEIIAGRVAAELELVAAWRKLVANEVLEVVGFDSAASNSASAKASCGEVADGLPGNGNEVIVQPPFDGWAVDQDCGDGLANWVVSCDELIIAVVANGIELQDQLAINSALEAAINQPNCDASELLDSIRVLCRCDVDESFALSCVVAVIDPLIGEVQLAQMGRQCQAVLSSCQGELTTVYRNHACFMTRGQSICLSTPSESELFASTQLTFHRSK